MLKDMTNGNEARHILAFTFPLFIGNAFQQAYNMVDAIVVGRYIGHNALAAVGTSFPVLYLMISMVLGLTVGASVVISQLFGAKDYRKLKRAISTFIFVLLGTAILISIGGLILTKPLLMILQTP
jgi:Na+-driven multidrug efflux pump